MLVDFLQNTLSGDGRTVSVRGLSGALSARATIEQIAVSDDEGVWLTIDNAVLDWNRLALIRGRFSVNALTAEEINIERAPGPTTTEEPLPTAEAKPFQLPELPVAIEIGELRVDHLVLGKPLIGVAADLKVDGALDLADGALDTHLDVTRLDRPGDTINLTARFENENSMIGLDLEVIEDAGGLISTALRIPGQPSLQLTAKGDGPVTDFTADISLSTENTQRVAGQVRLREVPAPDGGSGQEIAFTADLGGDLTPFLADDLDTFFGTETRLHVDGRAGAEGRVELSELDVTSNALRLEGELSLARGQLEKAALQARITPPQGETVVLPVPGGQTTIGAAQLSGLFDQANGNIWDLSLTADDLKTPEMQLDQALLTAQGTLQQGAALQLDGDLQAALDGLKMADPALDSALGRRISLDSQFGLRDDQTLEVTGLELVGADYVLDADAVIDGLESGFHLDGSASLDAKDLSRFSGLAKMDLAGSVSAKVVGNGSPLAGSFDGKLDVAGRNLATGRADIDPLIAGETTISLDAKRGPDGLTIRELAIDGAALTAQAAAVVTSPNGNLTVDGTATVEAPDLSVFSGLARMNLGGAAQASVDGKAALKTLDFDGTADITGQNLKTGRADIDPLISGQTEIHLDASRTAEQIVIRSAKVNGAALQADVVATITDPDGALSVEGRAEVDAPDLSLFSGLAGMDIAGSVKATAEGSGTRQTQAFDIRADLDAEDLETGLAKIDELIQGRTTLDLDAANGELGLQIRTFRLDGTALTATAQGRLSRDTGELKFTATLDDLSRISTTTKGPLVLSGGVSPADNGLQGHVSLKGPDTSFADLSGTVGSDGSADLDFDARLDRLERYAPEFPGSIEAKGNAKRDNGVWTIDATAKGPAQIDGTVAGTYNESTSEADLGAKGTVAIGIANKYISPNQISGTARFDMALKGKPGLDALSGKISTSGTTMALPNLGQTITGIGGDVTLANGTATAALQGGMRAGGSFTVSGPVELKPPFNGQITVALNDLVLTDQLLYETSLNGQVTMSGPLAGNSAIAGQIDFGETNINLAAASGAVGAAPIPPIRHVNEPGPVLVTRERAGLVEQEGKSGEASRISLDVSLLAPKAVFVRGRGVNAELGGRIHVGGTTKSISPSGQIDLIRGVLDILGRRLTLTKGVISLQGNLTPYIEFESAASTSDGTAVIEIAGPLDSPKVEITSDPERPPEEALAMLLFGNRFSELSPFVIAQMAASLAELSGAGGDATKGIRDATGVDTIDLGADDNGLGRVGVGAYLGENIYTDLTVNTEGETEVNLNLDLTDKFTVRGTVDSKGETGFGIFYERDY
ncbi:translocation/assembly module TamB [Ruegeria sediminis]|uniref:Translocation/assembly module TamB n=2 Tax=Ruegeria sediminis TaxID=2583820 RepID=A0ABY2WZP3_9RHOB|nr:translocation/assembly module TamB [Ruegeria sediminis]